MNKTVIEWKRVPTHHGYWVNRLGQIKGPSGKILKAMPTKSGHLYVLAPLPRRPRKLFVHRAVLHTFIGEAPKNHESRHKNGIPGDNRLSNLAWGTRQEQREDERRHGTRCRGELSGTAKLTEKQVRAIRRIYPRVTLRCLGKRYGVSHTTIRGAVTGHHWGYLL